MLTDGITEAMNAAGDQFGMERVIEAVRRTRKASVTTICGAILDDARAVMEKQADDLTLIVARFR